jgi:thioredoxin 1
MPMTPLRTTVVAISAVSLLLVLFSACNNTGPTVIESGPTDVQTFTVSNFDSLLQHEQRLILIDFFSPSCGHCLAMDPVIDSLNHKIFDRVMIGKVNIDEEASLKDRYAITAWPSFLFFSNGVEIHRIVGAKEESVFINTVDSLLAQ